ncbi:MAG: DUF1700 domain-containing protein [Peptococcaceae bacterium]|nr:DUF1700 domain-containing protein [Peptococcaceae bacterium]
MNRNEFVMELRKALRRLPPSEVESALRYYEEYFDEAGPENEAKVLAELGSPGAVAAVIIGEYAVNELEKKSVGRGHPLWLVLLGIFASPVALPLAFAVVVVVAALIFTLIMVFLALGIAAVAVVLQGVIVFFAGIAGMGQSFGSGLFFVGFGLLSMVLGVLLALGIAKLSRITFAALQKGLGNYLIRKGARKT